MLLYSVTNMETHIADQIHSRSGRSAMAQATPGRGNAYIGLMYMQSGTDGNTAYGEIFV
jgi:hypothetical protein